MVELLNSTTYKDNFEDWETEIGDSKQKEFFPQVKVKKWNNEVNFSMRLVETTKGVVSMDAATVKYDKSDVESRFYSTKDGFEFEIVLKEKPKSNVLNFTLQSKGLSFFYQPIEFTKEEIDMKAERPDYMKGGYVVYHSSKKFQEKGKTNYGCGKAFNIHRPFVLVGKEKVWCDLKIDSVNNTASITIPQKLLDTASYPLVVDPTFGYTNSPTSATSSTVNNSYAMHTDAANLFSPTGDFTISEWQIYCHNSWGGTDAVQMAIYEMSDASNPNTRAVSNTTVSVSSSTVQYWSTSGLSLSVTGASGKDYCMAFGCSTVIRVYYDRTTHHEVISTLMPATWTSPPDYTNDFTFGVNFVYTYNTSSSGTNMQLNIGDSWKVVDGLQINIGDSWKTVTSVQQNIGDTWRTVF